MDAVVARLGRWLGVLTAAAATGSFALGCAGSGAPPEPSAPSPAALAVASPAAVEAATATPTASASASPHDARDEVAAPPPREPLAPPPEPTRVAIPGDRPVLVLEGRADRPIVYFHGKCGDPRAFTAWAETARRSGTVISMLGDVPCKGAGRTRWTSNPLRHDQRARAAIAAVEALRGRPFAEPPILVGYSQGALVAESLAARFPERYPRAVLAAGPRAPKAPRIAELAGVLLVAGELDVRGHLARAAEDLARRGARARYLELPGARHGQYGPEAEARMAEGLAWLLGVEEL